MFDFDKWEEIFGTIRRHKLRTMLTAFSVWWGIFMLVILLGAGKGMKNSVEYNFRDDAINTIWMFPDETSMPYKGLPAGRRVRFDNNDFDSAKKTEGVQFSSGRYNIWGEFFISKGNKSLSFSVRTVHPDHQILENTKIVNGRFINDKDIEEYRKICVIGKLVKEGFFEKDENPIGQYLKIKNIDYQIVGVFEDTGGEEEMRRIFLPISTAQKIEGTDRVHSIIVEVGNATVEESEAIEERLLQEFATHHKFSPSDKKAVHMFNGVKEFQEFQMIFSFIQSFIWFVGIGSIIAGVIGVSNIMLIVVKERTKEIGIRKAMGATPYSIVSMIVQESIFLTSIAGYFGMFCGLAIIYGVQQLMEQNNIEAQYFRNPEVNIGMILIALFILIISGAIAGLIPALQAVKVNPVEAMKG